MRHFLLVFAFACTSGSQAIAGAVCDEHGAVVTLDDSTVLYLGKNCDAARGDGVSGLWFNAASFLVVQIGGDAFRMTDEVDCLPFCESPL